MREQLSHYHHRIRPTEMLMTLLRRGNALICEVRDINIPLSYHQSKNKLIVPASTFKILAENWIDFDLLKSGILKTCESAKLKCIISEHDVTIGFIDSTERTLTLELVNKANLKWYYSKYPMAKDEPIERIPYYTYLRNTPNKRYYLVASANQYLNHELIFRFSKQYLEFNKGHLVSINGMKCINKTHMDEYEDFKDGWWNNIAKYFEVSNYNV